MRVLATIGFSFSAGVFLAALLPWNGWQLYAAGGVLLLALAWLFAARKQNISPGAAAPAAAGGIAGLFCRV